VEGYDLCQRMKNRKEELAGKYVILVVCDQLSKMAHFVATTEGMLAEGLARLFRDNMWRLHGLPESVVSD